VTVNTINNVHTKSVYGSTKLQKKKFPIQGEASRKLVKFSHIENTLKEIPENKKITKIKTTKETLRLTQTRRKDPQYGRQFCIGSFTL